MEISSSFKPSTSFLAQAENEAANTHWDTPTETHNKPEGRAGLALYSTPVVISAAEVIAPGISWFITLQASEIRRSRR